MNILVLNSILFTPDKGVIPRVKSIKDTMIYTMCLGFKKLGHKVTLVAADEYRPIEEEDYDFEIIFFKSIYEKIFLPTVLPYSSDLNKFVKKNQHKYDMMLSSEVFAFPTLAASKACAKKTVAWQELAAHQRKFHRLPSKIWHNVVAPLFQKDIIVVPRSVAAYDFVRKYFKNTSSEIVDHGVNTDKFIASSEKNNQLVIISQLIRRKNVDLLIKKFAKLLQIEKYRNYKLYIIGRGELEQELKDLTKKLGISNNVFFTGFITHMEMNQYVSKSKALLVHTAQDINMVSIPESIVSGTPILTNSVPTTAITISNNQLGIVKDNWDIEELAKIIDDNEYYVGNCIKYREKLTNTYCAQKIIDIFNSYQKKGSV